VDLHLVRLGGTEGQVVFRTEFTSSDHARDFRRVLLVSCVDYVEQFQVFFDGNSLRINLLRPRKVVLVNVDVAAVVATVNQQLLFF
jgi:hypothetical protein